LLNRSNELGRLAPGFAADIVGVTGNPLQNITDVVTGVRWVMKDGIVVVSR
jgi:imidazolonepropionase-like amidohydrolase